jgi:hypothetical protein
VAARKPTVSGIRRWLIIRPHAQGLEVTLVEDSHNNHFSLLDELAVADSPLSLALLRMIGV